MARQVFWLGCHPPKRAFPRGPHSQWHCCALASTLTAAGPPRIRTGFPWSSLVLFPDNYVAATPTVKSLRSDACGSTTTPAIAKASYLRSEGLLKKVEVRDNRLDIVYTHNASESIEPAQARLSP